DCRARQPDRRQRPLPVLGVLRSPDLGLRGALAAVPPGTIRHPRAVLGTLVARPRPRSLPPRSVGLCLCPHGASAGLGSPLPPQDRDDPARGHLAAQPRFRRLPCSGPRARRLGLCPFLAPVSSSPLV